MTEIPVVLTTTQLAELLSVLPKSVTRWRYKGGGPVYFKIGGKVRYHRDAVIAWIDAHPGYANSAQVASA